MNAMAQRQRFVEPKYRSPLSGVLDAAWQRFVEAMNTQKIGEVTSSGYGSFALRARRLQELQVLGALRRMRYENGRHGYEGDFVLPHVEAEFLRYPLKQLDVFARSTRQYDRELTTGKLVRPEGVSRSGALAILHRGGRGALKAWPELMSDTRALFEQTNNIF